jgi:Predicted hydrolases or acyltransferases (alpha/beta hydrolase superfamily)
MHCGIYIKKTNKHKQTDLISTYVGKSSPDDSLHVMSPILFKSNSYLPILCIFNFQGVKFHYVDSGDKNKPVILFLHGFPDFWISWSSQVPALVEYFR